MGKFVSLWLVMIMAPGAYAEHSFYVSADAPSGGIGSRERPYQTLEQARDGIRTLRKAGTLQRGEAVTVLVQPGVYPMVASFELGAEDGGVAGAPVVYRASQTGAVTMQGGIALKPTDFKPVVDAAVLSRLDVAVRGAIRVCDLSSKVNGNFLEFRTAFRGAPVAPWLYVDHRPMTLARWPNTTAERAGWASFSKSVDTGLPKRDATDPALRKLHAGSFVFDDSRPTRWNLTDGVWLLGYWTHDWSDEVLRIAAYDKDKKVLALAAPHSYGINAGTWGAKSRRFFAMNTLDELDSPGEWYLDRSRKLLYHYPDGDLSKAEIVLATLAAPLVKVESACHVKFIGLRFEYCHSDGIVAHGADHLGIAGCVIANLAGGGISLDGTACTVRSCDIFNIGRGGVSLNGGDRKSLLPAQNLAENNHIHHFGIFQRTYAPGIGANGCGQIARNNRIHDAPHNAVLYGGNEHLFERNDVYRVVMETGDAGAFYTGRDWTSQGNVLRNNYIHDLGSGDAEHVNTMGIYLDDCDCGDTLVGNVFFRAGRAIMIGGGRNNPVLNNLVVDCPIGLHIDSRGMTWKQWNDPSDSSWSLEAKAQKLNYLQPPWSTKYPRLASIMSESPREPLENPIRRNVFVDCTKQVCNFDGNVKKLLDKFEMADNLVVNTTGAAGDGVKAAEIKGFAQVLGTAAEPLELGLDRAATLRVTPGWQVWIRKTLPSFEVIPFEKIGLYKDEYRQSLPPR